MRYIRCQDALRQGFDEGVCRPDLDADQLWITIVAMVQFYFSNIHTMSYVLDTELEDEEMIGKRKEYAVQFVLAVIRSPQDEIWRVAMIPAEIGDPGETRTSLGSQGGRGRDGTS